MAPEEWPTQFTRHLNAGDLESVVALYEPNARFIGPSNELIVGRWRIGQALDLLIRSQTKLKSQVVQEVVVGDVAVLYTNFDGTTIDPSGSRVPMHTKAIEVLRRQENGTWQLIIGDPAGRNR